MKNKKNTATRIMSAADMHEMMDYVMMGIRDGTVQLEDAKEISRAANNKIRLAATELDYMKYRAASKGGVEIPTLEN
jgi:hypothetical protein